MPKRSTSRLVLIAALSGLGVALLALSMWSFLGLHSYPTAGPPPPLGLPSPPPAKPRPPYSPALVDRALQELDWGNIGFNAPSTMKYQRPTVVELLLSPSLSVAHLQERLQEKAGVEAARIQISNRMEAQLTGKGFAIQTSTPNLQAIRGDQLTRWNWEVTPTEHGAQTLYLAVSAYIDVAGQATPLVVRTFERAIDVEITVPQLVAGFVQSNWQWLWAAIVLPIAGYLWRRWKKARDARDAVVGSGT
jgi:hypothetical protein